MIRFGLILLLLGSVLPESQSLAKTTVNFVTTDWPPFYSKDQKNNGPVVQVTRRAFEEAGYNFKIKFIPWKTAQEQARRGKAHGILGVFKTEERLKYLEYTTAVGKNAFAFLKKKGSSASYSGDLNKLKGVKIGTMRGNSVSPEFDSAAKSFLTVSETNKLDQNFGKLLAGRIDLMTDEKSVLQNALQKSKKYSLDMFEFVGPNLATNILYNGVSKKAKGVDPKKVQADFDKGVEKLRASGELKSIFAEYGMEADF